MKTTEEIVQEIKGMMDHEAWLNGKTDALKALCDVLKFAVGNEEAGGFLLELKKKHNF